MKNYSAIRSLYSYNSKVIEVSIIIKFETVNWFFIEWNWTLRPLWDLFVFPRKTPATVVCLHWSNDTIGCCTCNCSFNLTSSCWCSSKFSFKCRDYELQSQFHSIRKFTFQRFKDYIRGYEKNITIPLRDLRYLYFTPSADKDYSLIVNLLKKLIFQTYIKTRIRKT